MLELIAQGSQPGARWRRMLPTDRPVELGRASASFAVPWDNQISRRHVTLTWHENRLNVLQLESAANPVFYNGAQAETFWLKPGEHFVIGETTITLCDDRAAATLDVPNPIRQKTFTADFLQRLAYSDADRRIEVLNHLPELISSANDQSQLLIGVVNTLLEGIESATTVGLVRSGQPAADEPDDGSHEYHVLHWDRRGVASGDFEPSAKLIGQAIESMSSVMHVWHASQRQPRSEGDESQHYTFDYEHDWAFCTPLDSQATPGWSIYVAGTDAAIESGSSGAATSANDLQGDVKFCELVASTLKNLLQVQQLERRQSSLRNFFSPIVLQAIAHDDPDVVLAPRECRVSVLFCDLRGFSRTSERLADNLPELLQRVSDSLGIATESLLRHGGVVGDFHGDAAMGFWGWPLEEPRMAAQAVRAAIDIRQHFAEIAAQADHPLKAFQVGVGIATGQAVAGKIGTREQVKVTAFGPVVNVAARLEGMTRWVETSVLVDEATAQEASASASAEPFAFQRLGTFQPYGMKTSTSVYRMLDDASETVADGYESALLAFEAGDWQSSLERLQTQSPSTANSRFLVRYIDEHGPAAPADWSGVIQLRSK